MRERDRDHAGHDHQEREQHLRHRRDQRRAPRRGHRVRRPSRAGPPGSRCTSSRTTARSRGPSPCRTTRRPSGSRRRCPCSPRNGCRRPVRNRRLSPPARARVEAFQPPTFSSPRTPAARSRTRSGRTAAPRCRSPRSARPGRCRRARSPPETPERHVEVPAEQQRCSSFAIAYIEMPDENTVMAAKEIALKPRVFSSKRSFRYSGTERAREP